MPLPRLPAPDEAVLHIHAEGVQLGPIDRRALGAKLAEGAIPANAHVWFDGMAGWELLEVHRQALLDGVNGPGSASAAAAAAARPADASTPSAAADPASTAATLLRVAASAEPAAADPASSAALSTAATSQPAAASAQPAAATQVAAATEVAAATQVAAATRPAAGSDQPPAGSAASTASADPSAAADPAPSAVAARAAAAPSDDEQDRIFVGLVKDSWDYLGEHRFASHIDEVFLGAVITSTLDTGYSLIDLSSDGTHHYLRFENLSDKSRIVFRLTHLTGSLAVSKVLGQRVSAVIGYGERVGNITKIWGAIQAEMKSAYIQDAEPGTITVDGDLNSGYVYCQVDLYLDVEQYVGRDYRVDHPKLSAHIGATTHALRKYLRGRFA